MATLTLRREDGRVVCERCAVADRAHHRMRGLLGRRRLQPGEGMVLRPAWNVHTAFMRFPIDVVVFDGANKVADALRTANAARARRPQLPVVIAADTGGRSPAGVRVFDRWNETEEMLLDIERLLAEQLTAPIPIGGTE